MTFKNFNALIQARLREMTATGKLFKSTVSGKDVWDMYLSSFSPEHDPVFRDPESSTHNCNCCKSFIRRYGNIVAIDEYYNIMTLFDVEVPEGTEYYNSAKNVSELLKKATVGSVFFESYAELKDMAYGGKINKNQNEYRLGIDSNLKRYEKADIDAYNTKVVKLGEVREFDHFHVDMPEEFIIKSNQSVASIVGDFASDFQVFNRAMEEIPLDTLQLVRDLIQQGSLLNGETHLSKVEAMIKFKSVYDSLNQSDRVNWSWVTCYRLPIAKFKNELIGVLCSDLAEGVELNKACTDWNKRVDPANYMKATAPITKAQIERAKKFVEENGYEDSFNRRFATIDDIDINEILHVNSEDNTVNNASIFDSVKPTKSTRHKKSQFNDIEEVSIEKFMKDILPSCSFVEAFVENRFFGNLVSITTANTQDSKQIFKWPNNFSWTYNGNLAGKSQLTQMVENAGGRTDGAFRFTHSWNRLEPNTSLMDLHVFMPGCTVPTTGGGPNVRGRRVGWNNRNDRLSGGTQDVDYTGAAAKGYIPVENIVFPSLGRMPEGKYVCKIHNWARRSSGGRGEAEIAFGGEVYKYVYPATVNHQWVTIAEVTLKDGKFEIEHHLPEINESRELWGLDSNKFHKVNLVCTSPNHWAGQEAGNKHYFFMLEGCASDTSLRSFHNENLNSDLAEHRKVMEVLGATNMLEPSSKQLAGLGFNATVNDSLIVKLSGSFKRTVKINF